MFSQILNALKKKGDDGSSFTKGFYATHELSPKSFHIEVEGVGPLSFPLDPGTIQRCEAISSQAKYGLREQTLLDKTVRHTHEIPGEKIKITYDEQAFSPMLTKMRDTLGLSENARLTAHLHNMLIYAPGQFFKEHQDSEKLGGMIASLVMVLPSPHIGGALVVNHNTKTYTFATENLDAQNLQCLAFYADCPHEVKKVKQGYRVALTYNLVLEPSERETKEQANLPLEKALAEYFGLNKSSLPEPQEFVYFLDHSYTEHSLRWKMLKGVDRQNALDFRRAAHQLGLISHLALVEIHESWTAEGDEDDPEPDDLIDESTTLSYWLDANDHKLPYGTYSLSKDKICWTKDREDFEPYETEYEGYMGNYGNTVDYWYRRAAVVLWPAADQVVMDFRLNYEAALKDFLKLGDVPGNEQKVLTILKKVGRDLYGRSHRPDTSAFKDFARIAAYIKDQDVAKSILTEFSLGVFEGEGIDAFVKLQNLYGVSWGLELIEIWKSKTDPWRSRSVETNFDQVIRKLQTAGADQQVMVWLLTNKIEDTIETHKRKFYESPVEIKKATPRRLSLLKEVMNACDRLQEEKVTQKLISYVLSHTELYPEYELAQMMIQAKPIMDKTQSCYFLLRDHVTKGIQQELKQGVRDPNDWSIPVRLTCSCDLCKTTTAFLKSTTESTNIWPIVAADREHVMQILSRHGLPVTLSVEKKGSPHKLVMVKSSQLYQLSQERYDRLIACNEELKSL